MRNFPTDRTRRGAGPDRDSPRAAPRPSLPPLPRLHLRNPVELLREGAKLAALEADELKDLLTQGILDYSEEADKFITRTNAERAEAEIWGTITEHEAGLIAGVIVDAGKKYAPIAFVARQMGRSYTALRVGLITLPRFYETMAFYAQHGGFLLWSRPPAPVPAS